MFLKKEASIDKADLIEKLITLKETGALTAEEFEAQEGIISRLPEKILKDGSYKLPIISLLCPFLSLLSLMLSEYAENVLLDVCSIAIVAFGISGPTLALASFFLQAHARILTYISFCYGSIYCVSVLAVILLQGQAGQ